MRPSGPTSGWRRRNAQHIRRANQLVGALVSEHPYRSMPYVPPHYEGSQARIVSMLSNPCLMAEAERGSEFISSENDNGTAARLNEAYLRVGLSTGYVVPWNVYPWYVRGNRRRLPARQLDERGATLIRLVDWCTKRTARS